MRANKSLAASSVSPSCHSRQFRKLKLRPRAPNRKHDTFNSNAPLSFLAAEMVSRRHEKEFFIVRSFERILLPRAFLFRRTSFQMVHALRITVPYANAWWPAKHRKIEWSPPLALH